ncbi:MAG: hypothetical protein AAGB26_02225 [Planctomycetota bacterium]
MPFRFASEPAETQDRVFAELRDQYTILIVADGAGGMNNGSQAAEDLIQQLGTADLGISQVREPMFWPHILHETDQRISGYGHGGETTAVVAVVCGEQVYGASVGDSSAWWIDENDWYDLTAKQIRKPLLGSGSSQPMPFGPVPMRGTLMLASDGLTKYAKSQVIVDMIRAEGIKCARELISLGRLPAGGLQDDATALLYEA